MKLLKDLTVSRKELVDWDNALQWSKNGTLYFNTSPDITIGQPLYQKDVERNAKSLFHVAEYPLVLDNYMEYETATTNTFLNTQPMSFIRTCKPSRSGDMQYLAVLSNNFNISIHKDKELVATLDQPGTPPTQRCYHAMEWSPNDNIIVAGNEIGQLTFFQIDGITNAILNVATIQLEACEQQWITHIRWMGNRIMAGLSDNSVWYIDDIQSRNAIKLTGPSRFKIFDMAFVSDQFAAVSSSSCLRGFDLETGNETVTDLPVGHNFYLVPMRDTDSVSIISNLGLAYVVDLKLTSPTLTPNQIIRPHLEAKYKKWNDVWNELGKYETTLNINGVALSPDGYSLSIIYDIERVSLKYIIPSQRHYSIMFVPLCNKWKISNDACGMAWYQTYTIYKTAGLPFSNDDDAISDDDIKQSFDTDMEFSDYLSKYFEDPRLSQLRFNCFIDSSDDRCVNIFRQLILKYAMAKKDTLSNPIDIACIESLAKVLGTSVDISSEETRNLQISGDYITQTFDFNEGTADLITSKEGNSWKRCSVTLLPLLSTDLSKCPVTGNRVINIANDKRNNYGWFTKTLLDICDKRSIYSGISMNAM